MRIQDPEHGLGDFGLAAIVEGDDKIEPGIVLGAGLGLTYGAQAEGCECHDS